MIPLILFLALLLVGCQPCNSNAPGKMLQDDAAPRFYVLTEHRKDCELIGVSPARTGSDVEIKQWWPRGEFKCEGIDKPIWISMLSGEIFEFPGADKFEVTK